MSDPNLALFQWLVAGTPPAPFALFLATAFALGGAWLSAGIVGFAIWKKAADRAYLWVVLAATGPCALLCHAIALRLDQPRPFVLGLARAYIDHAGRGSLPSTHASVMFLVAVACLLRPSLRCIGLALLASAIVTGWARIYVGVHFPIDIAAGLALGAVLAGALALALRLARRLLPAEGAAPATWRMP
ncbi:phosphatase PAP2 family protein [Variovorax sp. DAIF25]|uniref:phosphatase PAP2 family protein n=1 Tax=Variovorax sp. DAIF25 TaxID=3080983 RepID=UPI003D6A6317